MLLVKAVLTAEQVIYGEEQAEVLQIKSKRKARSGYGACPTKIGDL